MNRRDASPDYKRIYTIVKLLFEKTTHFSYGPLDETFYTMRVYETAKVIMSKMKRPVKQQLVLVAALLHDTGKTKMDMKRFENQATKEEEWRKHPLLSVPVARNILKKLGHSTAFIDDVCYLVEHHADRLTMQEKSVELQVLQDADLLADTGIAGVIRPFLYGGKHGRSTIFTIEYLQSITDRVEEDGMLNLLVSKRMAAKKTRDVQRLVEQLSKEIDSDLLE
jgi:HD superfamily phosphodiesterase